MNTNKEKDGKEMRTSAIFLIIIGAIGTVYFALESFGVTDTLRYFNPIPLTIFAIFLLVMGILSISSANRAVTKGKKQNEQIKEIREWFNSTYNKDYVEGFINPAAYDENDLFYIRTDIITSIIKEKYALLDEQLLSELVEEFYEKLYE